MSATTVNMAPKVVEGLQHIQEHFDSLYGILYSLEDYIMSVENENISPAETLNALRDIRKIRHLIEPLDVSLLK